ncbi:MAG TPA: hypothetical protein PLP06_01010 [Saprospiraceae bacterium]|nr:hypothetical protein [Saprospiraceae bacterium]
MIRRLTYILGLYLAVACFACLKPPVYPIEPIISMLSMTKDSIRQASIISDDSIRITFNYTDGDGDLGDSDSLNVFLTDNRTSSVGQQFKIPFLPENAGAKGISGEIALTIRQTCCIYSNGQLPCTAGVDQLKDTMSYSVQIKDRAGHYSNSITTPPIYILCK